jgi:hypothetical protein
MVAPLASGLGAQVPLTTVASMPEYTCVGLAKTYSVSTCFKYVLRSCSEAVKACQQSGLQADDAVTPH